MKKTRHGADEIAAKLRQADEMLIHGKLHSDVVKTLGVSIMTYYRWRKARRAGFARSPSAGIPEEARVPRTNGEVEAHMAALQVENARLRHLVADLLLDKVRLEEVLGGKKSRIVG